MTKITISVLLVAGILLVGLLFRFGTISPCGMLTKELRSTVLHKAFEEPGGNQKASLDAANAERKRLDAEESADPQREADFTAGVIFGQNILLCFLQAGKDTDMGGAQNWACANREAKRTGRREWPPIWSEEAPFNRNFLAGNWFGISLILCRIEAGIDTAYAPEDLWACANQKEKQGGRHERPPPASWESAITQYHPRMNAAAKRLAGDFRVLLRKGDGYVNEDAESRVECWRPIVSADGRLVCGELGVAASPHTPCPRDFNINKRDADGYTIQGLCWTWANSR